MVKLSYSKFKITHNQKQKSMQDEPLKAEAEKTRRKTEKRERRKSNRLKRRVVCVLLNRNPFFQLYNGAFNVLGHHNRFLTPHPYIYTFTPAFNLKYLIYPLICSPLLFLFMKCMWTWGKA